MSDNYEYKDENGITITENDILHDIMELVKSEPNNMELGKKIRARYFSIKDGVCHDQLNLFGEGDY